MINKRTYNLFEYISKAIGVLRKEGFGGLAGRVKNRSYLISRCIPLSVRKCFTDDKFLKYSCNICGANNEAPLSMLKREVPSCTQCGSTVRMRAMVHVLSLELFGKSLIINDFPVRPDIVGIGMSDWDGYARPLSENISYTNTYYHREPRLDITSIDNSMEGTLDFIISSDVFEHVMPPVSMAFKNAYRMLKPGGVLVFSAPYAKAGSTIEHFPDLQKYEIIRKGKKFVLKNTKKNGVIQIYSELIFHGGPGDTLEMRLFSEPSIREELSKAGFTTIKIYDEPCFDFGIAWEYDFSLPMAARK